MPIDSITGKQCQATEVERVEVIEMHAEGYNYREIAEKTSISKSEAQRIVTRWRASHTLKPPKQPGKKPAIDERSRRWLRRINDANPRATLHEIAAEFNIGLSERTVSNALWSDNYYVHFARKKPWLDLEHRRLRLSFARQRKYWTKYAWCEHVFTDEIRVELGSGGGRARVRRPPRIAFENRYLEPSFPGEKISVMFWAAFTYGYHTPLIALCQRTEKQKVDKKDRLGVNSSNIATKFWVPMFSLF